MVKNGTADLNNILFEQLERLNDDDYMAGNTSEIERAHAVTEVAQQIIHNRAQALQEIKTFSRMDADAVRSNHINLLEDR